MAGSFLTAKQKCQTSGQDQWHSVSRGCELHPHDGQGCRAGFGDRSLPGWFHVNSVCFSYSTALMRPAKLVHKVRVKGNT